MGRHLIPRTKGRLATPVLVAAALAPVLVAGGLVWWLVRGGDDAEVQAAAAECAERRSVAVAVAPEMAPVAERVLAEPQRLDDGSCAVAEVIPQEPLQTLGDVGALQEEALPDLWVPDSSMWAARAGDTPLEDAGSVASSPVVLATSRAAADDLGWIDEPPSWVEAMTGDAALAMPDLESSAEGLAALAAVRTSLGTGEDADNTMVEAVLGATRDGPAPTEALGAAAAGEADAPVVPVSEQEVFAANAEADQPELVAIYPRDGSPTLDFPVLRVRLLSGDERAAVDAVVGALTSEEARAQAGEAGFRTGEERVLPGAGGDSGVVEAAPEALDVEPAAVDELLGWLSELATPSRMLAVFDISASMADPVGTGTRATLARDAAKSALALFPDTSAIGLWVFARGIDGGNDWTELVPTRNLDADAGDRPQRETLIQALDSIPARLTPGGTGLYDTTLAAVRAAQRDHDPAYLSSVVIITDGRDEDQGSIGLDRLVQTLRAEADPDRPVKVIAVAAGPDADPTALRRIAEATGGTAHAAVDEQDLQTVLFDALRQRG